VLFTNPMINTKIIQQITNCSLVLLLLLTGSTRVSVDITLKASRTFLRRICHRVTYLPFSQNETYKKDKERDEEYTATFIGCAC